ncbi:hypothetical protein BJV82DRAFT_578097 [Fennellomyces sp. T-0311]|nr:hypothetical protein BJV82DRAFT_578097 [Fennellomyces sp. T-0311]
MTKMTAANSNTASDKESHKESRIKRPHGGRHRIFTEEQRKVRNRLAQAAFRERRTQYTQTLESTIVDLENIIHELQESNRNTSARADVAEQRCADMEKQNKLLQELLAAVTTENHLLLQQRQQQQQPNQFISVPESFESESGSVEGDHENKTPPTLPLQDVNKSLTGECSFRLICVA